MYLKVSEGEIDQKWKDENIADFWTFHDVLSNQIINYNPTHHKYKGEKNMRPATQHKKPQERITKMPQGVKEGIHQKRRFNFTTLNKIKEANYCRGAN